MRLSYMFHGRCFFLLIFQREKKFYTPDSIFAMLFCLIYVTLALLMTETERKILETLVTLENTAAKMPTSNPKPDLRPLFARIESLAAQLPRETDRELLHFLHRKSYQKARAHLEQR